MKNVLWSAIYDLVQEVDSLLSRAERFGAGAVGGGGAPADGAPADANAPATPRRKAAFFKAYQATDDLVEVRTKLRGKLEVLKAQLAEHLTEREGFLVLFPLVVLFDELVQNRFLSSGQAGTWPPLQSELFKIDDGGEVFYNTLDDLLRKPDTLPFIYEVFYLCLSDGFKGRYADNLAKINEYKHKLETKIPQPIIPRPPKTAAKDQVVQFGKFPVARYVVVGLVLVAAFVALQLAGGWFGR